MTYDHDRQRTVLFGGNTSAGAVGDTWEWDGSTWWPTTLSSGPSPRHSHAMAYDSARQKTVLFGGSTGATQTWEWNGSYWAAIFASISPGPMTSIATAYDPLRSRVLLVGGVPTSQTWEFDGSNWNNLVPLTSSPGSLGPFAMTYDGARQVAVLVSMGTWINTLVASATVFGAGCGQPPLAFTPNPSGRPVLGLTGLATVSQAPTNATFVAMGSSNQSYGSFPLPVTLASIGMIGCDLYQSAEVLGIGTSPMSPATLSFSLSIPNTQSLIGLHLYMQAYAFAPGANPLNVIISNAIDWRLGTS